ncbi:MAG: MBL fold metallo-hydrolase [Gemmatimonadota bacterium]
MRTVILAGFLALAGWTVAPARAAAQEPPSLEVIPVQGNVYMLQTSTAGGNMAVLAGPDGVLLVDDQIRSLTESVVEGVRAITEEPIRFVVNTHVHIDHIGGNEPLAERGATIVAHENVRTRMLKELRIPRGGGRFFPQPPAEALPLQTYESSMTFHMNGEEVRVLHVPPSHTDGDSFVYFTDSDVLHTGDVFRTNMYPIVDVYNGGTIAGMIEAMEIAVGMAGPDTKVIPGHGFGFTDRDGLIEVRDMLVDLRAEITGMIEVGMNLEDVMAAEPTAEYDERWLGEVGPDGVPSWGPRDLVPIIYFEAGGGPPTVR